REILCARVAWRTLARGPSTSPLDAPIAARAPGRSAMRIPPEVLFLAVLGIPVVLIALGGLGGFSLYPALVRRLKLHHNALWLSLGSPGDLPVNFQDYWNGALFAWIVRRDYLGISDPGTARLARICRLLFLCIFAGLACIALLVLGGLVLFMLRG